ncbi:MAG: Arm DNA-binding domain-containing protein, partial [Eubacterium sp.]
MAELNARKRNGKWEYRFEAAKIDGKRKQVTKGGFTTKKECLSAGARALAEYNSSGLTFIPSEISVSDYLDYWLDSYEFSKITARFDQKPQYHLPLMIGYYTGLRIS